MGLQIRVVHASTRQEIDAAFEAFAARPARRAFRRPRPPSKQPAGPIGPTGDASQVPAATSARDIAQAGGLMSYGANITDTFRQVGV